MSDGSADHRVVRGCRYQVVSRSRPEPSRKFHEEMQPFGCDQELLFALRTRDTEAWGLIGLYRQTGRPAFTGHDLDIVRRVAPALAAGARHTLLLGQACEPDLPQAPGLVILDEQLAVEAATPSSCEWLASLGQDDRDAPASVLALAGQVLRESHRPAQSRVRAEDGRWIVLHGARLAHRDGRRHASIVIKAAHPTHLTSLLMRAYGLTSREWAVTHRVLRGESTNAIARRAELRRRERAGFEATKASAAAEAFGTSEFEHYARSDYRSQYWTDPC